MLGSPSKCCMLRAPNTIRHLAQKHQPEQLSERYQFSVFQLCWCNTSVMNCPQRAMSSSHSTPGKIKVYVHTSDGTECDFDSPTGITLAAALRHEAGILLDEGCEGTMACSIYQVYVDKSWMNKVGSAEEAEQDLLDQAFEPHDNSRLSCMINLTEELDGIKVALPAGSIDLMLVNDKGHGDHSALPSNK